MTGKAADGRYIVDKAPGVGGNPIPEDEPCIVIRGQDILALPILHLYIQLYSAMPASVMDERVLLELKRHSQRLYQWQLEHLDRMKVADR